jgi:small-conductance mechanosensitive channel
MSSFIAVWRQIEVFLTSGIGGSAFTPLRLLTVIALMSALFWVTRRVTRWLIDHVLARRGFEVGVREAI